MLAFACLFRCTSIFAVQVTTRGRELRKEEERRGREARQMADRCKHGRALPTDMCSVAQPY
jgi:hypothetical protein